MLALGAFLTLGPVIWTLWTSLTPVSPETNLPTFGLAAYSDVFTKIPVLLYVWNSSWSPSWSQPARC